jgi:hypothetical protein
LGFFLIQESNDEKPISILPTHASGQQAQAIGATPLSEILELRSMEHHSLQDMTSKKKL